MDDQFAIIPRLQASFYHRTDSKLAPTISNQKSELSDLLGANDVTWEQFILGAGGLLSQIGWGSNRMEYDSICCSAGSRGCTSTGKPVCNAINGEEIPEVALTKHYFSVPRTTAEPPPFLDLAEFRFRLTPGGFFGSKSSSRVGGKCWSPVCESPPLLRSAGQDGCWAI